MTHCAFPDPFWQLEHVTEDLIQSIGDFDLVSQVQLLSLDVLLFYCRAINQPFVHVCMCVGEELTALTQLIHHQKLSLC